MLRKVLELSVITGFVVFAAARPQAADLQVVWTASQPDQPLKTLSLTDLSHIKKLSSSEVDPETGKTARWDGISLGDLIEQTISTFPNDKKAQIDLVVLKNASGGEALIPRSFIVKYPFMLASKKDHKALDSLEAVAPWTSKSKSRAEGLPLETYFLNGVTEVDLANYRERFGSVFLKNRTEPTALRGEKAFIQNCLSCHDGAKGESGIAEARKSMTDHPAVKGAPKLDDRERRALKAYIDIYQLENPTSPVPVNKTTSASSK
jgi:hypothetical protein